MLFLFICFFLVQNLITYVWIKFQEVALCEFVTNLCAFMQICV